MDKAYWKRQQKAIDKAKAEMEKVFAKNEQIEKTGAAWTREMIEAWDKWHLLERATLDPFGYHRRAAGISV